MSNVSTPSRAGESIRGRVERIKSTRVGRIAWRSVIAVVGIAVIVVGVVLLPLPGPGWLIIFAGLGILGSEFEWARRLLRFARDQLRRWTDWVKRQSRPVQAIVGMAGVLVIGAVAFVAWSLYH